MNFETHYISFHHTLCVLLLYYMKFDILLFSWRATM